MFYSTKAFRIRAVIVAKNIVNIIISPIENFNNNNSAISQVHL